MHTLPTRRRHRALHDSLVVLQQRLQQGLQGQKACMPDCLYLRLYAKACSAVCLCGLQGDQGSRCGALLVHPRHVPGAGGTAVHLPLAPGPPLRPCCGHRAVRDVCGGAPGDHHPGEARAPPQNLQTGVYPEGCTCICCMLDAHCQASICHPGAMTGPSFDCALGCGEAARHRCLFPACRWMRDRP